MTRALIHGAGRMARMVLAQMPVCESYQLAGIVSRTRPDDLASVDWFGSFEEIDQPADLLIDFTLPGGTRTAAHWCAANNVAFLSGTTGLLQEDFLALEQAALSVPVLWAPNLSRGVALIKKLVAQTAASLGADAKIHVTETHHVHKLDAPSGTALALADAAMEVAADLDEPTFTSLREGEVIGEHSVRFSLADEVIEISHSALTREVFANGALNAGEWLVRQTPGFYSTSDWLGIN